MKAFQCNNRRTLLCVGKNLTKFQHTTAVMKPTKNDNNTAIQKSAKWHDVPASRINIHRINFTRDAQQCDVRTLDLTSVQAGSALMCTEQLQNFAVLANKRLRDSKGTASAICVASPQYSAWRKAEVQVTSARSSSRCLRFAHKLKALFASFNSSFASVPSNSQFSLCVRQRPCSSWITCRSAVISI